MFWRFGGIANVPTIDTLLEKPDVTLEELLNESDLLQELKQQNSKLLHFLQRGVILEKLMEYVITPKLEAVRHEALEPSSNVGEYEHGEIQGNTSNEEINNKQKNRYAYVAAEILSSDNWVICESLMNHRRLIKRFWEFLNTPPPLDPLQASYFTKVNEALLDKRTVEMLFIFKCCKDVVKNMLRHVDSPMIMDLLLKIISLERGDGQGILDWLQEQNLIPMLLSFLSSEHSCATQTSAGDFIKAIITISANTSQNQQSCVGPNELTRQLVSQTCIENLIMYMLRGGNPLTVGVGIVIEVIRKNNSDYDPFVGGEDYTPSSRDPIYLGTLLRLFAQRVPEFIELMLSSNQIISDNQEPGISERKVLPTAFGEKIEPLGFNRFKLCELMAELLHCSNMGLLNEADSEEIVRRRDLERERLKIDGELGTLMNDSIMRMTRTEEIKRLHIQNASDDDGFERVSHSSDDDVNEYGNLETSSFAKRNDEDFHNESLPEKSEVEEPFDSKLTVLPLSPIKSISKKIDSLGLEGSSYNPLCPQVTNDLPLTESDTMITNADEDLNELEPISLPRADLGEMSVEEYQILKHQEELHATTGLIPFAMEETREEITKPLLDSLQPPKDDTEPFPLGNTDHSRNDQTETSTRPDTHINEADTVMEEVSIDNSQLINVGISVKDYPVVGDFLKMQFVEYKVIPTILDFFFRFPWNNFLHNVVYDVVQQVFNGPMERGFNRLLAFDLFETGDITTKIVNGQKESDKMPKMRLGYMGHLTLIAEEFVKFTERHPSEMFPKPILRKIMNTDWVIYVDVTLAKTRERDNAILGGYRPVKSVGPRPAGSNIVGNFGTALTEAGLNGFSPSDVEDDEMAGAEYITDLPPPAAPPPLPSLHIHPSRARLQLAARLALHKSEKDQDAPTEGDDVGVSITTEAKHRTTLDDGDSDEISLAGNADGDIQQKQTPDCHTSYGH